MKEFPSSLSPANYQNIKDQWARHRQISYIRRYVFERMLSPNFSYPDNCAISLENFTYGDMGGTYVVDKAIIEEICKELESLGWSTRIGYGGSSLWIFHGEVPSEFVHTHSFE